MAYLPQPNRKKLTKTWQSKEHNKLYSSYKWKVFRLNYLKRHPLCIECKKIDITMRATVIDHIVPITRGGSAWDENNMQPLCSVHHAKKTGRESNEYNKTK